MNIEPKRVLIAEDHYVSRHLLERNLNLWGFEVIAVADGAAALEVIDGDDPPSLVILDWTMPEVDGLEVCRRVRQREDRPFIFLMLLTARSDRNEINQAFAAGADDYVIKPFDADELRARLNVARRVATLERALATKSEELRQANAELEALRMGEGERERMKAEG